MPARKTIPVIIKRDGTTARYDRRRITTAILKAARASGQPSTALARDAAARVERALLATYGHANPPTVEEIQDVVENVLMQCKHTKIARNYIIYRHERAMLRSARASLFEVTDNIPYRKLYEVLRWNMEHGCESVSALNRIMANGQFPALIAAADLRLDRELDAAAQAILDRRDVVRLVIVAGPSSSGKTTTTLKMSERLTAAGIGVRAMNLDNYFFDLEQHPRDEFGDYDYEDPRALDLALINTHLGQLLAGESVLMPNYDFKTGRRSLNVHPMKLAPGEMLLIDSLHGLYDPMTASIPPLRKFRLYIETLGQIRGEDGSFMRWADNRLLRRMIRDKQHRNQQPIETLTHWHYVRRSELKHIIPYIKDADYVVNTALPYELPFLKSRLFPYIRKASSMFGNDPRRLDAHLRVTRIHDLLSALKGVRDDAPVPGRSLLREFIGGSEYRYH